MFGYSLLLLLLNFTTASYDYTHKLQGRPYAWPPNRYSKKPKVWHRTEDLIRSHRYPVEVHEVVTEDGYILQVHRVPYGKYGRHDGPQRVAVMGHGLVADGSFFVVNGPENSLAYCLADHGYDVWLINFRGTYYSQRHTHLSPDSFQFWRFSFHEMGRYDLPAVINYIMQLTYVPQIDYIGFSMGNTIYFIMCDQRPEYRKTIRRYVGLAPAVYRVRLGTIFAHVLEKKVEEIQEKTDEKRKGELFPNHIDVNHLLSAICHKAAWPFILPFFPVCFFAVKLFSGPVESCIDKKKLAHFFDYYPAPTSVGTFLHFIQIAKAEVFQHYDFGLYGNLQRYGYPEPPVYQLSNSIAPTAIFWSSTDLVSTPSGVLRVMRELPNLQYVYRIQKKKFNHNTFMWTENAKQVYHLRVIAFLLRPLPFETTYSYHHIPAYDTLDYDDNYVEDNSSRLYELLDNYNELYFNDYQENSDYSDNS